MPGNKYNYKNSKKIWRKGNSVFDTSHIFDDDYAEVVVTGKGRDAADFVLVNNAKQGDIVVTHDYGLAAMACSKGAKAIHPNGFIYTEETLDGYCSNGISVPRCAGQGAGLRVPADGPRPIMKDLKKLLPGF